MLSSNDHANAGTKLLVDDSNTESSDTESETEEDVKIEIMDEQLSFRSLDGVVGSTVAWDEDSGFL